MDTFLPQTFLAIDALLIAAFRWCAPPWAGFLVGMTTLACGSALVGRLCGAALAYVQRSRRTREEGAAKKHHELSLAALRAHNKPAYLASNHLAQEAYGNAMALAAGRAAAGLWPACAALAWLYWRFAATPLPLVGESAGPAIFFLPLYGLAQWGLSRLQRRRGPSAQALGRTPLDDPPSPFP